MKWGDCRLTEETGRGGKKTAPEVRTKRKSVEQRAGQKGQRSEKGGERGRWREGERESLPSSLVLSSTGLLCGPSPIRVYASTCSTYIEYFCRASSSSVTPPSPSATCTVGGPPESFSLYVTWTQTCTERAHASHMRSHESVERGQICSWLNPV